MKNTFKQLLVNISYKLIFSLNDGSINNHEFVKSVLYALLNTDFSQKALEILN